MKQRKISQVNARHYKKRVKELEQQVSNLFGMGPGTYVWGITNLSEISQAVLRNTRDLQFNLRAKLNGDKLELYAVK